MRTLIVIKPDWVENCDLLSELYGLIKEYDLNIIFSKKISLKEDFWREFYIDHLGTSYFEEMVRWMSSSQSFFLIIDGERAIDLVRCKVIGRNGFGLRGKYQVSELRNVAHASDSEESATREINLVYGSLK